MLSKFSSPPENTFFVKALAEVLTLSLQKTCCMVHNIDLLWDKNISKQVRVTCTFPFSCTFLNNFVNLFSLLYDVINGMKKKDLVNNIDNLEGKVVAGNDIESLFQQTSKTFTECRSSRKS